MKTNFISVQSGATWNIINLCQIQVVEPYYNGVRIIFLYETGALDKYLILPNVSYDDFLKMIREAEKL